MSRTCAVCGKPIYSRDICGYCWELWCKSSPTEDFPEWVKELIKIQHAFEVNYSSKEISEVDRLSEGAYREGQRDLEL